MSSIAVLDELALMEETTDGTPLVELGLGLPEFYSDTHVCPVCEHRGWLARYGEFWQSCDECDEHGMSTKAPCRACNGTTKFVQERTGQVVACFACRGTGKREMRWAATCRTCRGTKIVWLKTPIAIYSVCWKCDGYGEIIKPVYLVDEEDDQLVHLVG